MTKSNSGITKPSAATEVNVSHGATHIPNVGGKLFRRTSKSAD